jgi:hypothetical protein
VRLSFGVNDEAAFYSARDELLRRFAETPLDDDGGYLFDVRLALDWKWGFADGDLGSWALADVEEFLLGWCPRKITMPPEEAAAIPRSLSAFLSFLAREGLLGPGSAPLHTLHVYLAGIGDRVVEAMGDRSRFGMGKSLFAGMADLGALADMSDPESLQEVMDAFNALPYEVRGDILGLDDPVWSPWELLTEGVSLPPAAPVPAEELSTLAQAAPILDRIGSIRDFVGAGRKLTAKGNLTVADAKALAALLGDPSLEMHATYGFSIRSAGELHQLQFLLRWARAAGAVRVAKGKISSTASWAKLSPVAALTRATRTVLDKGPLALETADHRWLPRALTEVLDEGAPHLLALLWALPDGMEFESLLAAVEESCDMQLTYSELLSPESRSNQVRREVDDLFDVLELAGVVTRIGGQAVTDKYGITDRSGGVLALTRVGRAVLAPYLREHRYEIPEVGELADRPLTQLFERIGAWHPDRTRAEFDNWVQVHSRAEATDQMTALLGRYSDPQWPVAAVDLAGRLGSPDDERAIRRFLETPARGHAINWLIGHGASDVPDDPPAMLRAGVEMMAMRAGGDTDVEFLDLITAIEDIECFIEDVWRVQVPETVIVLEGIGRVHPDKGVAKSARKAVFRHRSLVANLTS